MNRREMLGLSAAGLAALSMTAQSNASESVAEMNSHGVYPSDPKETINLWPGTPPGGKDVSLRLNVVENSPDSTQFHNRLADHVMTPLMAVFRPEKPNGTAVLVAPGGGYLNIWFDKEGYEMAPFLNAAGITVFVLRYRLPAEGWADGHDVPLQDAQRAIRQIRAHAKTYGLDQHKIGVMGFSAGGHLAATALTRYDEKVYEPVDATDSMDPRPDFGCLLYPVITTDIGTHQGSRNNLLGTGPKSFRLVPETSCENRVTANTPPTFIALAGDDGVVPPIENGIAFHHALLKRQIPAELHVFEHGGHGFAIRQAVGLTCAAWPELFISWAAAHGFALKSS